MEQNAYFVIIKILFFLVAIINVINAINSSAGIAIRPTLLSAIFVMKDGSQILLGNVFNAHKCVQLAL